MSEQICKCTECEQILKPKYHCDDCYPLQSQSIPIIKDISHEIHFNDGMDESIPDEDVRKSLGGRITGEVMKTFFEPLLSIPDEQMLDEIIEWANSNEFESLEEAKQSLKAILQHKKEREG